MTGMRYLLRVLILAAAVCSVWASEIDGKWLFVMQTEGGERRAEPEFKTDGDKVTGKWDNAAVAGTFKESELALSFPMTSHEGQMSAKLNIKAKLAAGELKGTWEFGGYSGTLAGKKAQ